MYPEDNPDGLSSGRPRRVVHCKSAKRQPAKPSSHRDSRSLRRTPSAGPKLPCTGSETLTRRCESQVRNRGFDSLHPSPAHVLDLQVPPQKMAFRRSEDQSRRTSVALYAHPRIRQKASELRPHEDISGYVIDHDLSPCQVVLSVRADSPLSLQHKQAKRFPEEIPSGPVWVDKFGLSSTRTVVFWVMPTRIRQRLFGHNIIGGKDPTRKEFAELTDYADSRQSGSGPPKSVTQHERVRVVS
jgi:hypothetical protein